MSVTANLNRLIDLAAPYWAGEAEVFRTYWDWPGRTRATDRHWLALQCFKEIWGSGIGDKKLGLFMGPLKELEAAFPKIDIEIDRHEVRDTAEALWAEFAHYCAFADAYDALGEPGEPKINPHVLKSWPEDDALATLRYDHIARHGAFGRRACRFTEGGYCTLFSEGMRLRGRGGVDDIIATACTRVYEDEFGHMLKGIVGLDQEGLSPADWRLLEELTVAQLRLRIRMRNAQFGNVLPESRVQEIYAGRIAPLAFDYDKARLAA